MKSLCICLTTALLSTMMAGCRRDMRFDCDPEAREFEGSVEEEREFERRIEELEARRAEIERTRAKLESLCPECRGAGHSAGPDSLCDRCMGDGTFGLGHDGVATVPIQCDKCDGTGRTSGIAKCSRCNGTGKR